MNQLIVTFLLHLLKRATSEESPISPRGESFFEIKNWTALLKWENGNQTYNFAKLFELEDGKEDKVIGEVDENGKVYNNIEDVSLCQRRVFQIKVQDLDETKETQSDPLTWTPPSYSSVSNDQTDHIVEGKSQNNANPLFTYPFSLI